MRKPELDLLLKGRFLVFSLMQAGTAVGEEFVLVKYAQVALMTDISLSLPHVLSEKSAS